jgi:mannitol-1-phosphate 5-dehydrogenase
LLVVADAHHRLRYDGKATRAGDASVEGFCPVTNFKAEVERKIFTYNLGHAALAYLGYMRGHTYIHETFDDPFVSFIFTGALDETTAALLRRYPADLSIAEHSQVLRDVRVRFGNPLVRDVITRVAKDPIRKLGPNDRLIGAAKLCLEENVFPDNIARVCAAAMCYDAADDADAVRLARLIDAVGIEETLRKVTGIDPKTPLGRKIIEHYCLIAGR